MLEYVPYMSIALAAAAAVSVRLTLYEVFYCIVEVRTDPLSYSSLSLSLSYSSIVDSSNVFDWFLYPASRD